MYHSGSHQGPRHYSNLSSGRDCYRIGRVWGGSRGLRPPEVSKNRMLAPTSGQKSTGRRACYLVTEPRTLWQEWEPRWVLLPNRTAGHVWQEEVQWLQDAAETEREETQLLPSLNSPVCHQCLPWTFNQRQLGKGGQNAVSCDTEQSEGHNRHSEE